MSSNTKPLFVLGLPTNGEHSWMFTQFLLGTEWPTNFAMHFRAVTGYEVGDARNILVQEAINSGAKYLVTIDEDVFGPANGIRTLFYRLETHPEWTVCGGVYATKTIPPEPLIFKEWGAGPAWDWKIGELIPVVSTGCGFHMFRVSDLAAMKAPQPYTIRNPWSGAEMVVRQWFKTGKDYVNDAGVAALEAHTEDSWFYKMCEEEGLQVWIDTSIQCRHYNKHNGMLYECPTLDNGLAVKPDPWHCTPRVANLGAGGEYNPYEVSVDLREDPHISFRADIRKLPEDWENQFDIVKANHVLEHLSYVQTAEVLREWIRILKPGGWLKLNVPDLESAAQAVLNAHEGTLLSGVIFGDQGHPFWRQTPYGGEDETGRWLAHSHENNSHKAGFTKRSLGKLLSELGLKNITGEREIAVMNLYVEGQKPDA